MLMVMQGRQEIFSGAMHLQGIACGLQKGQMQMQ
jgi:hypothetical protein